MAPETADPPCTNPEARQSLTAYSFGELSDEQRFAFALHLVECDACWRDAQTLGGCVDALRHSPALRAIPPTPEVFSVLGVSGRLDQPFAGHVRHAVTAGSLFALLFAVPVVVEVAYQFDRYGATAVPLAVLAFAWMLSGTLAGLWQAAKGARHGTGGIGRSLVIWALATAVVSLALWPFFPPSPVVEASFGTWPANLAYLKSVFYAWLVGPLFLLWPFHFVVAMQRELARGRHRAVLGLLTGDKAAVPPRGTLQPNVWALGVYLAGLFVFNYVGVNHLFGALDPSPFGNLFRALVLLRAGAWLLLPSICLWWFVSCLNELKREAVATERLLNDAR
jgi:hypothetical protein